MGLLTKPMRKMPSARITFLGMPIHSRYILKRIQSTPWADRQKILDLMQVELFILDRAEGRSDTAGRESLAAGYPEETRSLEAELLSAEHFELRKRRKDPAERMTEEARRLKDAERQRTEDDMKREWTALGGKP